MNLGKHGVTILQRGACSLLWAGVDEINRRKLDALTLEWFRRESAGQPPEKVERLVRDLLLKKVAARYSSKSGGQLVCWPASWAQFEQLRNPSARVRLPDEEDFRMLSVFCLVETSDGHFILSKRGDAVADHKDFVSGTAAGYAEFESLVHGGFLESVYTELEEEAGIVPTELLEVPACLGVCTFPIGEATPLWIQVCYLARTSLGYEKVLANAAGAKDAWEANHHYYTREHLEVIYQEDTLHPPLAATLALLLHRI